MTLRNLFNFICLALFIGTSSAYAECILNRYGQELCVGEEAIYHENSLEGVSSSTDLKLVVIKDIDYNLLTIKVNGKKIQVAAQDLIGKRNCKYFKSPFCDKQKVEIKSECQKDSHTFKTVQIFYNDLVLIKRNGLFSSKKEIVKTDCLMITE